MASDARAARRRLDRAIAKGRAPAFDAEKGNRLVPDRDYATSVGWAADEAALPEARQVTHDGLLRLLGGAKRGVVTWRQYTGEEADRALSQMKENADLDRFEYYRRISGKLREFGGYLVVAMAPADRAVHPVVDHIVIPEAGRYEVTVQSAEPRRDR